MKIEQISLLKDELKGALPGHAAHSMVMRHRKGVDQLGRIAEGAKESAALLHLYPKNNELYTVFILRATYRGVHSAQVGLPGGKREVNDQSLEQTALREAWEELAIQSKELEVLGKLSALYVPPSNFMIHPYVSFQSTAPHFIPQEREVSQVIEYKFSDLFHLGLSNREIVTPSKVMQVKGYEVNDQFIWGATAMIVTELLEVVRRL